MTKETTTVTPRHNMPEASTVRIDVPKRARQEWSKREDVRPAEPAATTDGAEGLEARAVPAEQLDEPLRQAWQALYERAAGACPALAPAWMQPIALERAGQRGDVVHLTAWRGGRLVALVPVLIRRQAGVRVAEPAGVGRRGYHGFLFDPDATRAMPEIAAAISGLLSISVWRNFLWVPSDPATRRFFEAMGQLGYRVRSRSYTPRHLIDLPESLDAYLREHKSGRRRRRLRSERRQIEKRGRIAIERFVGRTVSSDAIQRAARVQQRSWMKRRGAAVLHQPHYRSLLQRWGATGVARLWIMTVGGRDAAFAYGTRVDDTFFLEWIAFDLAFVDLSVGKALLEDVINDLCRDGCRVFDFSEGDGEYKQFWATRTEIMQQYVAARGVAGRTLAAEQRLRWRLKEVRLVFEAQRRVRRGWQRVRRIVTGR